MPQWVILLFKKSDTLENIIWISTTVIRLYFVIFGHFRSRSPATRVVKRRLEKQHTTQSQELDTIQPLTNWMTALNMKLQSPIVRLYTASGKALLVIADYQEAQDIVVRWHLYP